MTTPPISTADREKAKDMLDLPDKELEVMRELSIKDQWLVPSDTRRLIQEIRALRARVVELEAAVKVAEARAIELEANAANAIKVGHVIIAKPLYDALQVRATAAEAALRPFAREADAWADSAPDSHRSLCTEPGKVQALPGSETTFTVGDLRAARAVLADRPQEGTQE